MSFEDRMFDPATNEYRTLAQSREWAAQLVEEALDPDLPIVDAHHHFFEGHGERYGIEALHADATSGHKVEATVYIECDAHYRTSGPDSLKPVGETDYVVALAKAFPSERCRIAAGIVGFADLFLGDRVDEVLEAQIEAGEGRFRGIRYRLHWDDHGVGMRGKEPPRWRPGIMLDSRFQQGFSRLAKFGLSFDAWQYHFQLPELRQLARKFPDTRIVIDHFGGPIGEGYYKCRSGEVFDAWRAELKLLAEMPNIVMKVGGFGMLTLGFGFHLRPTPPSSAELCAAWQPVFDECMATFGPGRCLFESNFPVDRQSFGYGPLWNALKRLTRGYPASERAAMFWRNASRIYRIDALPEELKT
jgi:L-fuconolactonase